MNEYYDDYKALLSNRIGLIDSLFPIYNKNSQSIQF